MSNATILNLLNRIEKVSTNPLTITLCDDEDGMCEAVVKLTLTDFMRAFSCESPTILVCHRHGTSTQHVSVEGIRFFCVTNRPQKEKTQ